MSKRRGKDPGKAFRGMAWRRLLVPADSHSIEPMLCFRYLTFPLTITALVFGDPLPGQSALDKKRRKAADGP